MKKNLTNSIHTALSKNSKVINYISEQHFFLVSEYETPIRTQDREEYKKMHSYTEKFTNIYRQKLSAQKCRNSMAFSDINRSY